MKKLLILIIIATTIYSCNSRKKDLLINLHSETGFGVFMPGRKIIFPSNDSIEYKGVPNNLKEFVVRSMPLQGTQYFWDNYKNGKIDKERFLQIVSHYQIDTTEVADIPFDYEVAILIGTNQKEKKVIIIDSDNDEDFNNERILEYEFPLSIKEQKRIEDSLETISASYQYFHKGQILNKTIELMPSPYKGRLSLGYNTKNKTEKKYDLFVSVPNYKKGEIITDKTRNEIYVSNGFTSQSYSKRKSSIFISNNKESHISELDGDIPYQIGDIINIENHDYLLDTISLWGDTLKLKYIGKNTHPTGITEGKFMPKFHAKRLDNSVFSLEQYPNKYILIDFWGTWCNPCIKLIPELKKINSEYSDDKFVLVSVAYDRDPQKVADFIRDNNMDWEHIFVSQTQENKNSLIEKLKINSFPSTILVDPEGKIIARNIDIEKLKKILTKRTNAL